MLNCTRKSLCVLVVVNVLALQWMIQNTLVVKGNKKTNTLSVETGPANRTYQTTPPTPEQVKRRLQPGRGFHPGVLLFSAIAGNSTNISVWDKISLNGWESDDLLLKDEGMCCVMYMSGEVKAFPVKRKLKRITARDLQSRQYICILNSTDVTDYPKAATVVNKVRENMCPIDVELYVGLQYAYRHTGEIAVFTKVIFGSVEAYNLLVWFEIHRLLGFHKVITYPFKLNQKAMKVLVYYQGQGLLEIIPFAIPGPDHGIEETPIGTKTYRGWTDKDVALDDGLERLRGYKYIVNMDFDEYIIPKKEKTWMTLFNQLFDTKPKAAGFSFRTYQYITNWGPSYDAYPFDVDRYVHRTEATGDRVKHVSMPSRLKDGGLSTHWVIPVEGYIQHRCSEDDAMTHHFRACRTQWLEPGAKLSCMNVTRHRDDTVFDLFMRVKPKVDDIIIKLGL